MTVRNLKIDSVTGDLVMANGNLVLVGQNALGAGSDADAIGQAITAALRTFQGEYFLDPTVGVPYFQNILGPKNPDPRILRSTFKNAIESVKGVRAVTALDLLYTAATRSLAVSWRATGDAGQLLSGQTGV